MVNLMLTAGGLWGTVINWFNSFIPSFGLTIIVFTVILKLVLSPLEVYQKINTKKQSEMQAKIQPEMEKLQKKFANNREMLNQKTAELYKRENFNVMGSCLGMLINLVLTLVIFITLFSSLNQMSQYNIKTEYETLRETYTVNLKTELLKDKTGAEITIDSSLKDIILDITNNKADYENIITAAKEYAAAITSEKYGEIKEGFLWIKNIYRPDTYVSVFPSASEYLSISNTKFSNVDTENTYENVFGDVATNAEDAKTNFVKEFDAVTTNINTKYSGWNGYLILVLLAGLVTVLSQILATKATKPKKQTDKKGNEIEIQQPNMKLMMFLLPALMVIFTLQYSAAFALYIVINSLMSVIISYVTGLIISSKENKKEQSL